MKTGEQSMYGISSHKVVKRGENYCIVKQNGQNLKSTNSDKIRFNDFQTPFSTGKSSKTFSFDDLLGKNVENKNSNRISIPGVFPPDKIRNDGPRRFSLRDLPDPNTRNFDKRLKPVNDGILKTGGRKRRDPFTQHCQELNRMNAEKYPQWSSRNSQGFSSDLDNLVVASSNFVVNPKYSNVIRKDPRTNQLLVSPTFETLLNDISFDLEKNDEDTENLPFKFLNSLNSPRKFQNSQRNSFENADLSKFQVGFVDRKRLKLKENFFDENIFFANSPTSTVNSSKLNEYWPFSKAPQSQKIIWKPPPRSNFWFQQD